MAMRSGECDFGRRERRARTAGAIVPVWLALLGAALAGCAGGGGGNGSVNIANSQAGDPATVDYPIFYVKRTVPTDQAGNVVQDDLRIMRDLVPSADLYERGSASPSAVETNITARVTAGAVYDVKDVDTSPDGSRVVFAMRGPIAMNQQTKNPPSWRIWQYVIATDTLAPVINPAVDPDPPTVNDVSPHYLADGRIVFSSTRQTQSQGILLDEHKPQFSALDEARVEPAFVLEVMNADGTGIHQISFNQSHDRDATLLENGRVLWSRWDNAPGKDGMALYSANPDGTDLELYYGANSHLTGTNNTVVEFVRPREMPGGAIMALIRQYTNVDFGGNLVIIDGNHYVENTQPLLAYPSLTGPAQTPATTADVVTIPGPSPGGRFESAYPLWDGTGRILVSWSECRLLDTTQTPPAIVPCTTSALAAPNPPVAPPLYSVWMLDAANGTMLPVLAPVEGVMVTDVAVAQPRPAPAVILDKVPGVNLDQNLVNAGVGVIDIRSVYDIDGVDTANPDIATVADPKSTPASSRPARFIRLEKAVSIPDKTIVNLSAAAFGASNYMLEILGYAPIEPDGSMRIEVPADVAFRLSVLDANARRIGPPQGVWLQLIPGEVVSCNGCHTPAAAQNVPACTTPGQLCPTAHSHGRQGLFASAWAGAAAAGVAFPHTVSAPVGTLVPFIPQQAGETMADARIAVSCANDKPPCAQMVPSLNVLYSDVWTDPAQATPGKPINYSYDDPSNPIPAIPTTAACATAWSASCRSIINYPEHIQPIWDAARTGMLNGVQGSVTCTQGGCHNPLNAAGAAQTPAGNLDLTSSVSNTMPPELTSYVQLLFPHNTVIMGQPGPTVGPFMTAGSANGGASSAFFSCFATTGPGCTSPSHVGWLNIAELRLLSEWLDIGAQNYNNPFDPKVPVN
ncbi:MAG TPA: hypothetical protein VEU54_07635 [Steroidobacteraceae bacterium]|nr:hypothetical protein [Steroidobacteraceae bacterium]